jgi:hypothetical protein
MRQATHHQDQRRREGRADAAFKPVALPALAAAVKAAREKPREAPHRELPPILRNETAVD